MSLEDITIKQQKCKSCNIPNEQKAAHWGYILSKNGDAQINLSSSNKIVLVVICL
jgi:hypothetical protein